MGLVTGVATSTDAQLRSRFAHVVVSSERRLSHQFEWMQQHLGDFFIFGRYVMAHRREFAAGVMAKLKGWLEDEAMQRIEDERARMVHGCAYAAFATLAEMVGMAEARMLQDFQAFLLQHAQAAVVEADESVMSNQFCRDLLDMAKSGQWTPAQLRRIMKVEENPQPRLKLSAAQIQAGVEDATKRHKHLLLFVQLNAAIAMIREWKRRQGQELLVDRQDLQAQMGTKPYYVEPPEYNRKRGCNSHRVRFAGKTKEYCICVDLDYLAYMEVSDEEFAASQLSDPAKGEFFPRAEWVDPRRGDLFALVDLLQGKGEEGEG